MIIKAVILMTIIGFLAGVVLAVASKFFYVAEDSRLEAIKAILPGINCGSCGFVGCTGAARGIISKKAPVNVCCIGGFEVMNQVADILGLKPAYNEPVTVVVGCTGGNRAETRFYYKGLDQCKAENLLYGGSKICETGWLGNDSCVRVCPFDAIHMNPNRFPEIDENKWRRCGKCVEACPKGVLSLMGFTEKRLHMNQTDECLASCRQKCPAQVDVPQMIQYICKKDYHGALLKIKERNPLVLSTGRVCHHTCENICRRNISDQGVAISQLERFVGAWEINLGKRIPISCAEDIGHRIAIIGNGPAGLSCAYFLRRLGHHPIIFEKKPESGGMLRYGITEYRLPKRLVDWDINGIITFGKDFFLSDLKFNSYQAIFIGIGAWIFYQKSVLL